jgi:CheY-like chemotaxis protein
LKTEKFDIVLMDILMPIVDGIEATITIRTIEKENNLKSVPIIGVSANARKESMEMALKAGMNDYITKPYLKDDIVRIIRKWAN